MGKAKASASQSNKSMDQHSQTDNRLSDFSMNQFNEGKQGILDTISNYNTNSPYQAYTGQQVAGLSPLEQQARQFATSNVGKAGGILDNAMQYDGSDVSKWYNQYEQDVVQTSRAQSDENRMRAISQGQADATLNNAYDGTRHGVRDAETNRLALMDQNSLEADLKYKGFNDARAAGDRYQQAQFQGAQLSQQAWQQDAAALNSLGASDREIEQAKLLADRAQFDEKAADEYRRMMLELQTRQGILGAAPMITNSGQHAWGNQASTNTSAEGGFNFLGDLSDRRLKDDIEELEVRDGRQWYTFRYVWEEPGTRREGLMAQDLLASEPERVQLHSLGFYTVNYQGL
jgi:hypothetical protein